MPLRWLILAAAMAALSFAGSDPHPESRKEGSARSGDKTRTAPTRSYLIACTTGMMAEVSDRLRRNGAVVESTLDEIGVVVASSNVADFSERTRCMAGVVGVAPNRPIAGPAKTEMGVVEAGGGFGIPLNVPNPPFANDDDALFDLQWNLDAIDAPEAWAEGARGTGVLIGLVDTGIDPTHPDLVGNVRMDLAASFVPGENVNYNLGPPTFDGWDHGTHVAGLIAAADNGFGIIGVAPEAKIVPVQVISRVTELGLDSWVMAGILYAINAGVDIVNLSIGGYYDHSGYFDIGLNAWVSAGEVASLVAMYNQIMSYAKQKGVLVVAAAGNSSLNMDGNSGFFALPVESPHVLGVSALGPLGWADDPQAELDTFAWYSNYGNSIIEFSAPGGNVDLDRRNAPFEEWDWCQIGPVYAPCWIYDRTFSCAPYGFDWGAGTSFAAPHVVGVAALIIEKHNLWRKPQQVTLKLKQTTDDLGQPSSDRYFGHGRINAYNAVK